MNRKKSLLGSIIKGTGFLVGAAGITYGTYLLKKSLDKNGLTYKIKAIAEDLETSNTSVLNFKSIIKEDWDQMYIFQAYTSYEKILEELGIEWDEVYKTGITYKDDITLLVFRKDQKVVNYIEYPKEYGDFSILEKDVYSEGLFELYRKNGKIFVKESTM